MLMIRQHLQSQPTEPEVHPFAHMRSLPLFLSLSLPHTGTRPLLLSLFLTFPVCLSFQHYPCFSLTHIHYVSSCLHYLYLFSLIFSLSSLTPFPSLFIVMFLPPV